MSLYQLSAPYSQLQGWHLTIRFLDDCNDQIFKVVVNFATLSYLTPVFCYLAFICALMDFHFIIVSLGSLTFSSFPQLLSLLLESLRKEPDLQGILRSVMPLAHEQIFVVDARLVEVWVCNARSTRCSYSFVGMVDSPACDIRNEAFP